MTILTAKLATELYGKPDGDPHGAWAKANIVYCGGGGKAERPAMPGVPPHLWFAVHRRAEPKLRAAFTAAFAATGYHAASAGCWVYRHQRHDNNLPLSNHSWGAAVDIDAKLNPGRYHLEHTAPWSHAWHEVYPHGLPRAYVEAFLSVGGITWGGSWPSFRDPMHFEVYDPEG